MERRSGKVIGDKVVSNSFGFRSGITVVPEEDRSGKFRIEHHAVAVKYIVPFLNVAGVDESFLRIGDKAQAVNSVSTVGIRS